MTFDETLPGVKTALTFNIPDQKSGKVCTFFSLKLLVFVSLFTWILALSSLHLKYGYCTVEVVGHFVTIFASNLWSFDVLFSQSFSFSFRL